MLVFSKQLLETIHDAVHDYCHIHELHLLDGMLKQLEHL